MVKSGLDEEQLAERKSKPTVSQYRLTTHLGAAFLMYLGVLWTAFEIFNENKLANLAKKSPEAVQAILKQLNNPALKKTKIVGLSLLALTFVTAMSGGMVAGLDAGLSITLSHTWVMIGFQMEVNLCLQSFPENQINQIFGGEIYWKTQSLFN